MFPKSIEVQMENKNAGDFWCIVEDIEVPDMETSADPKKNGVLPKARTAGSQT